MFASTALLSYTSKVGLLKYFFLLYSIYLFRIPQTDLLLGFLFAYLIIFYYLNSINFILSLKYPPYSKLFAVVFLGFLVLCIVAWLVRLVWNLYSNNRTNFLIQYRYWRSEWIIVCTNYYYYSYHIRIF